MKTWLARWYRLALLTTFIEGRKKLSIKGRKTSAGREINFLFVCQVYSFFSVSLCLALAINFFAIASLSAILMFCLTIFYIGSEGYKGRRFRMAFLEGTLGTWIFLPFMPLYGIALLFQIIYRYTPQIIQATPNTLRELYPELREMFYILKGGFFDLPIGVAKRIFRMVPWLIRSLKENPLLNGVNNKTQTS